MIFTFVMSTMNYTSKAVYQKISYETNDPIVEWKICEVSGAEFPITKNDLKFYEKVSPIFGWKKYQIPTPRLCPEERQRRRLLFRNERKLYRRKCDATGENIISMYSPDSDCKVYNTKTRWSDVWNPNEYSLSSMNWMRIDQILEKLSLEVPKIAVINDSSSENSRYVNQTTYLKWCYLVFDADHCESCLYSSAVKHSADLVDCLSVYFSRNCYDCVNCTNVTSCVGCLECNQSENLINCVWCTSCTNCYECSNLVNASYCIRNKQVTKEEYDKFIESLSVKANKESWSNYPKRCYYHTNSTDSYWTNLYESKNVIFSYNIWNWNDLKYCSLLNDANDCYDYDVWWDHCELLYECETVWDRSGHSGFLRTCWWWCSRLWYCIDTIWSTDCFGCIGMRNAQYCIFNRQVTKEQYEQIVPQIIEQMQKEWTRWEFFDPSISPFGYNETVAQEYFPLTREEAIQRWYKRQDKNFDPTIPPEVESISGGQIPSDIRQVDESILKKIFVCEESWRPYRIVKQELAFYKKNNLPLPRRHPDIRHNQRMQKRPWRTLYLRNCGKTWEEMLSVYPTTYKGIVYNEKAYQQEVFW